MEGPRSSPTARSPVAGRGRAGRRPPPPLSRGRAGIPLSGARPAGPSPRATRPSSSAAAEAALTPRRRGAAACSPAGRPPSCRCCRRRLRQPQAEAGPRRARDAGGRRGLRHTAARDVTAGSPAPGRVAPGRAMEARGGEKRRVKARRNSWVGIKDSLTGRGKAAREGKANQGARSLLPLGRRVLSHPRETRAPSL